jgi:hypothetical protein
MAHHHHPCRHASRGCTGVVPCRARIISAGYGAGGCYADLDGVERECEDCYDAPRCAECAWPSTLGHDTDCFAQFAGDPDPAVRALVDALDQVRQHREEVCPFGEWAGLREAEGVLLALLHEHQWGARRAARLADEARA